MPQGTKTLYINNLNERVPQKQLRRELEKACAGYGAIAIYTGRSVRKRGQAFVAFGSSEDAQRALEGLQNCTLLRKPLRVALSRAPSDIHLDAESAATRKRERLAKAERDSESPHGAPSAPDSASEGARTEASPGPEAFGDPHNVLLVQHIPDSLSTADLQSKCEGFAGFVEARMFAVKHVGFLEFESVAAAEAAIGAVSTMGIGSVTYAKK